MGHFRRTLGVHELPAQGFGTGKIGRGGAVVLFHQGEIFDVALQLFEQEGMS